MNAASTSSSASPASPSSVATVFRTLIYASLGLGIAGHIIELSVPGLIPASIEKAYETYAPFTETTSIALGAYFLTLLVTVIVAAVGLLLMQRWARGLALWITVISLFSTAFMGVALYSALAMAFFDASTALWGAVLAMAYFSDVRVHFDPPGSRVVPATTATP